MRLFDRGDAGSARAIAALGACNPFLEERIALEREALGDSFTPVHGVWSARPDVGDDNPNLGRIADRASALVETARGRLQGGLRPTPDDRALYQDLCLYVLYDRFREPFLRLAAPAAARRRPRADFYDDFLAEEGRLLGATGVGLPHGHTPERLFACLYQVRRAFHHTFRAIGGGSLPAARLRARVWQSVFTHDLRRYQRSLHARMGDVTTLVTGPSGAGKELVARAIGLSRFVTFDPASRTFAGGGEESFFPLNLSSLSPTLIESELFGHRRGAFTGAVSDRTGWLAVCPAAGTVFLDEIGDVAPAVQVKLLRVLETRTFQPLGSSEDRRFQGKVVAATNRDLAADMRAGRFREDLYYRLCADTIVVPSLRERLAESPGELDTLVRLLAERLVGPEEAASLAREASAWIRAHLPADYGWPGNVRELGHCVSNVMIHRDYRPASALEPRDVRGALADSFLAGDLTADEVLRRYCTVVLARTGSHVRAAAVLGLDRRTVRSRVDRDLLAALRRGGDGASARRAPADRAGPPEGDSA
jgi:hypothetical protein